PGHPGHRVQVDAQFVGMLEVVGDHRVRVEVDAAQVDRPGQAGRVMDDRLFRRSAARISKFGDVDPVGPLFRRALLEHGLLIDALDEAFQDHRPTGDSAQRAVGDRQVVVDQVELGVAGLTIAIRKDHLVGMGDLNPASAHVQRHRSHGLMLIRENFPAAVRRTSHSVKAMPNLFDLPGQAAAKVQQYLERGASELHYLRKIIESGTFRLENPLNYAAMSAEIAKWGEIGMLPSFNARRTPNRAAIIDDAGELTYKELDEAANAVAHGLLAKGVKGGDGVAILARNHRWFAIAEFGCARVGARIILLNSSFSGPQITEVSEREGAKLIIYDDEYTQDVSKADPPLGKLRALDTTPDGGDSGSTDETLADLVAANSKAPAPKASKHSSIIILTSGTTGTPKGANRSTPPTLAPIGGILSRAVQGQ